MQVGAPTTWQALVCARPNLFANPTLAMAQNSGPSLENELNTYRTIQKEIGKVQSQVGTAQTQIL